MNRGFWSMFVRCCFFVAVAPLGMLLYVIHEKRRKHCFIEGHMDAKYKCKSCNKVECEYNPLNERRT